MKLTLDERVKHRLIGLAVLASIAAMVLPAIMKKSNHSLEAMSRVAVRLPAKPVMPKVTAMSEERLFRTVKVSRVSIPPVPKAPASLQTAMVQSLIVKKSVLPTPPVLAVHHAKPTVHAVPAKPAPAKVTIQKPVPAVHQAFAGGYAVQVARFDSLAHANQLVHKLRAKGFRVRYALVNGRHGQRAYRVLVGPFGKKDEVIRSQRLLYSQLQLRGFVVAEAAG